MGLVKSEQLHRGLIWEVGWAKEGHVHSLPGKGGPLLMVKGYHLSSAFRLPDTG